MFCVLFMYILNAYKKIECLFCTLLLYSAIIAGKSNKIWMDIIVKNLRYSKRNAVYKENIRKMDKWDYQKKSIRKRSNNKSWIILN